MKKFSQLKSFLKLIIYQKIFCKKNLIRDLWIIFGTIFLSSVVIASNYFVLSAERKDRKFIFSIERKKLKNYKIETPIPTPIIISEEEIYQEIKTLQETIDISNWKDYQNRWYGFSLKYPANWNFPLNQRKTADNKWEARYQFRFNNPNPENLLEGFDLTVYENSKVKSLFQTAEFPLLKNPEQKDASVCQNIQGHIIETGDYPAEEIYIGPDDDCFYPTLFFTINQGSYTYNLSPKFKESLLLNNDPQIELTNSFPEFFSIASTLSNIEIVRPKPTPIKPKISASMPVSFKKDNQGRLVCDKKNDKPGKSNKTNKKHLDMECCLDPDEYPNPHCYYDPAKYGKYLK